MGGNISVCLPSNSDSSSGPSQGTGGGCSPYSDSTAMAKSVLVPLASVSSSRLPNSASTEDRPLSGSEHCSPQPRDFSSSRIQTIEKSLVQKGFSTDSAAVIARPQRASTLSTYNSKWERFCDWCQRRQIDPIHITTRDFADFLLDLFNVKKFAVKTIMVYRAAIASTIKSTGGKDFGQDKVLSSMIRHFHIKRPPKPISVPQWNLALVLRVLEKAPFEPMQSVSLRAMTLKTVFLLALASGRRRSEIHALDVSKGRITWSESQVILRPHPSFLAKNQVLGSFSSPITLLPLSNLVGSDKQERLLCPVRAIRWYLHRTNSFRGERSRLFIPYDSDNKSDCSAAIISKWIIQTVRWAYQEASDDSLRLSRVTAHEVRAISTSWAVHAGIPVAEVIKAATWRSPNSFISYYLRDMAQDASELQSLGPVCVSQHIV